MNFDHAKLQKSLRSTKLQETPHKKIFRLRKLGLALNVTFDILLS
ncbi:hypothetical protein C8R31_10227 [Nitrosospira sp. Nsp2]|nr:hypothetical protein C8R31_10227 [Nitrosospira sp. Nsp2]